MKNLKQALENGYLITAIDYAGNQKCLVKVKSRFPKENGKNFYSYWMSRKYLKITYPKQFENLGRY